MSRVTLIDDKAMNYRVSHHAGVQGTVGFYTAKAEVRAINTLGQHRDQGHSFIEVERDDTDRLLILNDTRGQAAAMSIEEGRGADPDSNDPGMSGLQILHSAVGISSKRSFPRRRRKKRKRETKRTQRKGHLGR